MITLDIPAPEFIQRFQAGEIPPSARVTVTYENDVAPNPALDLVEQWLSQAPTDPQQVQEAENDLREVQAALNATRKSAGARLLFPTDK